MAKKIRDLRPLGEDEAQLRLLEGQPVHQFTVEAQHIIEDAVLLNPAASIAHLEAQNISNLAASRYVVGMSHRFTHCPEDGSDDTIIQGNGAPLEYGDIAATRYLLQFTTFFLHHLHEQDHLDAGAYLRAAVELETLLRTEIPRR